MEACSEYGDRSSDVASRSSCPVILVMPRVPSEELTDPAIPIHRITTGFFSSTPACAPVAVDGPPSCSVVDISSLLLYVTYQQHL